MKKNCTLMIRKGQHLILYRIVLVFPITVFAVHFFSKLTFYGRFFFITVAGCGKTYYYLDYLGYLTNNVLFL